MRRSILLLLGVLVGCGDARTTTPVIPDFAARSRTLTCEPLALAEDMAVTEIRRSSDSTWSVLDEARLQFLTFDDDFRRVHRLPLVETGPGATMHPVSAVALGDTAVAVAARGGLRLVILDRDGQEIGRQELGFVPNSLAADAGGGVLVTPLPIGANPSTLLLRYDGEALSPLDVPLRGYADMSVNALGNSVLVEVLPDGVALVVHQFYRPRAFRVSPAGGIEELATPVPDAVSGQLDYVPTPPITDEQLPRMAVPAIAMSVDPDRSELYVMTRSGVVEDGRHERAVLRLSDRFDFLDGYTLPVHAVGMVFLPRRRVLVLVDDEDRIHRCPLPAVGADA